MSDIDNKISTLILIGIGLGEGGSITRDAWDALAAADVIYAEDYTASLHPKILEALRARTGGSLSFLSREEVEEQEVPVKAMGEVAEGGVVVFLTSGDALSATTHVHLLLSARRKGYAIRVIHGVSIMTAAPTVAGLSHYRFGRTVTVPFPEPGFEPTSPLKGLLGNLTAGLHTLVLLDIKATEGRYMSAAQGLEQLLNMAGRLEDDGFNMDTRAVALARVGAGDQLVVSGTVSRLLHSDMGGPMHCLIVPSTLSVMEEEAMELFCTDAGKQ